MRSKILYWLVYIGMWLIASLPFRALYILSDFLRIIMQYIVHYRRGVIRLNLRNSFPEKTDKELKDIENKYYKYICDYMLEDVKMLRMSSEDLLQRMKYIKLDESLDMVDKYGGVICLIPHYANFEWLTGLGFMMKNGDLAVQVYKPLHNKHLDELFKKIRTRFGSVNIAKHSTARELIRLHRSDKKMIVGLITDQSPNMSEAHHWTTFLNQDTVFMDGAERLSRMMNFPAVYCSLHKTRRGYCEVSFDLITEFPKETAEGEITEQFARLVEDTIRKKPEYWFWSHKRWKHTRESVKYYQQKSSN